MQGIPQQERIVLSKKLDGHVGKEVRQYARFHGGFGIGELNEEGKPILNFSMAYDFKIEGALSHIQEWGFKLSNKFFFSLFFFFFFFFFSLFFFFFFWYETRIKRSIRIAKLY